MSEQLLGDVLATARQIVQAGPICDACLGSAFGRLGHGWTNEERGQALRTVLGLADVRGTAGGCWVCQDLFAEAARWAAQARDRAAGIEFSTYLFAVKPSLRWQEAEQYFVERFRLAHAEPQKHAWNRTVGKAFEALVGHGTVDFDDPDVRFTLDVETGGLELRIASLFLAGRYRKLARGIPQTHWPCRRCRGRGCDACGGTGKQYAESVEEWMAGPSVRAAQAETAVLHGAGREDIDARMLGGGRPFALELCAPRRRSVDVGAVEREVNAEAAGRVEVVGLRLAARDAVRWVKETPADKSYRARVVFERPVTPAQLESALAALVGDIAQRTPQRVAHRRADLVRTRRLHEAQGALVAEQEAEVTFRTEGGLYVKELVSGDDGRTAPSLAELVGCPARVCELDVLDVATDPAGGTMESRSPVP